MPIRDYNGTKLFFLADDGKPHEISGITSIEMYDLCDQKEQDDFDPFSLKQYDCSFEFEIKDSSIFAILIEVMPNNWLKMYGIPMRRKYRQKKREK